MEPIIIIADRDATRDFEQRDGKNRIVEQEWEGTATYKKDDLYLELRFEYHNHLSTDNGGDGANITSKKPKGMSNEQWADICMDVEGYLEDDFTDNKSEWTDGLDSLS